MRELDWLERTTKKARLARTASRSTMGRFRAPLLPSAQFSGTPLSYAEGMATATKRSGSSDDNTDQKKKRLCLDPNLDVRSTLSWEPSATASLTCEAALAHGVNGQEGPAHLQRNHRSLFRTRVSPALHAVRLSPYGNQATSHQRRTDRRQRDSLSQSQQIESAANTRQCNRIQPQEETSPSEEQLGSPAEELTIKGGARPRERPNGGAQFREESLNGNTSETNHCLGNSTEEKGSGLESGDSNSNITQCETKPRKEVCPSGELLTEDKSEFKESENEMVRKELLDQLRDDYTDSQTLVRNLRQVNEQYEERINNLKGHISFLEARHEKDKKRRDTQHSNIRTLRDDYNDKLSAMRAHIESLEKLHSENQGTISDQQQQLSSLTAQLEQANSSSLQERQQFERLRSASLLEITSHQEELSSCRARLERLSAALARQRECLECSICLGVFSQPVTLSCGHSFCESCIETNRRSAVLPDRCPLCRRHIGAPVRSAVVSQLAEITHELEQWHV